jgi:hypothetical protein
MTYGLLEEEGDLSCEEWTLGMEKLRVMGRSRDPKGWQCRRNAA